MSRTSTIADSGLILADTCVWIAAEKDPAVASLLAELTLQDRLVMCGMVYAEILRGIQDRSVRDRRAGQYQSLQWLEPSVETWRQTAETARRQDRAGQPVPLTDAHVAALCIEHGLKLWTTDRHFDRIQGLRRYTA